MNVNLPYRQEIYRKIIHLSSTCFALLLWYFGKDTVLPLFICIAIIIPILDYARLHYVKLNRIFTLFGSIFTRTNEKVTIIALLVLSISDSIAAIVGIKYGKTKLLNKSLEGSFAFLISASIIILSLSPSLFIVNILAIFAAVIIELFSTPVLNDNLLIPVMTALVLTLGGVV
jgi:dolichol kinase